MKIKTFAQMYAAFAGAVFASIYIDKWLNPQLETEGISFVWQGWPGWYQFAHGVTRFAINYPGLFTANVLLVAGVITAVVAVILGETDERRK